MIFLKIILTLIILFPESLYSKDGYGVVLVYHRFDEKKYPSTSISSQNFNEQLQYLKKNNYNVLPVSRLIDFFYDGYDLPPKSVFITIDDAFKSFYENAFPLLKNYNFPFSVFLSTGFVNKNRTSDFMDWKMLDELKKNKGEIYNHSDKHKSFIEYPSTDLIKDIETAEKKIEKNLGKSHKIISYPYGESNTFVRDIVKGLGYKIAFSQHSSPLHFKENKYNLPRFSINDKYGSLERFSQIINTRPMNISFVEIINDEKNNSFQLNLKTEFNLNKINCFINSGNLEKSINDNVLVVKVSNASKNQRYRLNCTLLKNSDVYWFGTMIIKHKNKFYF